MNFPSLKMQMEMICAQVKDFLNHIFPICRGYMNMNLNMNI